MHGNRRGESEQLGLLYTRIKNDGYFFVDIGRAT
jgi:hypothetical protein